MSSLRTVLNEFKKYFFYYKVHFYRRNYHKKRKRRGGFFLPQRCNRIKVRYLFGNFKPLL